MTTITLSGGEKLEARLREIASQLERGGTLRVGFLESARYDDGTPVAMAAAINNFGAPEKGIPARPFFTKMVQEKSSQWGDMLAALLKMNDFDVLKSLDALGALIAGQLRESINETHNPPNSMATNLLKQRFPKRQGMTFNDVIKAWRDAAAGETAPAGKPLIWSGYMYNKVEHEVTDQ